jgi:hypothetical protein
MLKLSEKNKQKFKKYILKNSFEVYSKILNEFNSKGKSRIWNEFSAFITVYLLYEVDNVSKENLELALENHIHQKHEILKLVRTGDFVKTFDRIFETLPAFPVSYMDPRNFYAIISSSISQETIDEIIEDAEVKMK